MRVCCCNRVCEQTETATLPDTQQFTESVLIATFTFIYCPDRLTGCDYTFSFLRFILTDRLYNTKVEGVCGDLEEIAKVTKRSTEVSNKLKGILRIAGR